MNKLQYLFFKTILKKDLKISDAGASKGSSKTDIIFGLVKRLGLRNGDVTSKDFEDPDVDLSEIRLAYDSDSYIRQGVDKYVDIAFKEGHDLYGSYEQSVEYIKARFFYMAEATGIPTEQLFIDITEDVIKLANAIVVKSRSSEPGAFPPGASVTGIGGLDPVAGYFCLDPATMKVKRDKNGVIKGWRQETEESDKPVSFKPEDIVHFYYKRAKGDCYGTPFLLSVIPDVKALRQAEENVLKMMYRNIHPFYHIQVGDADKEGSTDEIESVRAAINNMDVEGGLITTNRVKIIPIASDKVIDAHPYLKYLEQRVFSGIGIADVMFGRGDTANRSTGDNMQSELAGRVKAIQRTVEMFVNTFMIRELLREGGFDPILNPEHNVEFKFKENNLDSKIKTETHAIYLYEHNAITEDEMRELIGRDPILDRSKMHQTLITLVNANAKSESSNESGENGTKETNNKQKPKNQFGEKTSPKKQTNSALPEFNAIATDLIDKIKDEFDDVKSKLDKEAVFKVVNYEINSMLTSVKILSDKLQIPLSDGYIANLERQINYVSENIEKSFNDIEDMKNIESIIYLSFNILLDSICLN